MKKLFLFDIETTGLDCTKHGIHQLSGKIVIDGVTKETFNFKVKPHPDAIIEDAALKVSGITREDLSSYEDMALTYRKLRNIISRYVDKYNRQDKFYLVGFNNASFDNPFLRQWFIQNGDNYFGSFFWSNCLDVMVLAAHYLIDRRSAMMDFKLRTVAAALGISVDESRLHDADYDIDITYSAYQIVTGPKLASGKIMLKTELEALVTQIWEPVLQMSEEDEGRASAADAAIKKQAELYHNFFQLEKSMQLS